MKFEEVEQNAELKKQISDEVAALKLQGKDPFEAEVEVLRAHGIEFDEDALRAEAVKKIPLDDDAMDAVNGGYYIVGETDTTHICGMDYSCYFVLGHDSDGIARACAADWGCVAAMKHCWSDNVCNVSEK